MRMRGAAMALVLAALLGACSDSVGPVSSRGVSVQLALAGPQLVSAAETAALGAAFDRVDRYTVEVVDTLSGETIVDETITVPSGSDEHVLDISVPEEWIGQTVRITLVAYDGDQELYRSVSYALIGAELGSVRVTAEVRYTGPGIRGTIFDIQGAPRAGVTVDLYQNDVVVQTLQTEDDGSYLFVGVATGSYSLVPTPPGQDVICPFYRDVTISSADDVIVTNFREDTDCTIRALVVSGGDYDETATVARVIDAATDLTADTTFFYVNQLPTLSFLSEFDVVLLFMNGIFDESASLGDRVTEYVNAGGNVVLASFYWQGRSDSGVGSVGWGALETIDPFTSLGGATYQAVTLGQVLDSSHPIMTGVTSIDSNSYSSGVAAKTGTTVIAEWSDGDPFVGFRTGTLGQRITGVSLFPAGGQAVSGDVDVFWQNVVRWTGEVGGPG
jgi:hypothetical protein